MVAVTLVAVASDSSEFPRLVSEKAMVVPSFCLMSAVHGLPLVVVSTTVLPVSGILGPAELTNRMLAVFPELPSVGIKVSLVRPVKVSVSVTVKSARLLAGVTLSGITLEIAIVISKPVEPTVFAVALNAGLAVGSGPANNAPDVI